MTNIIDHNFSGDDPDNLESKWENCPECGAALSRLPGTSRIEKLALKGLQFIGANRHQRKIQWMN